MLISSILFKKRFIFSSIVSGLRICVFSDIANSLSFWIQMLWSSCFSLHSSIIVLPRRLIGSECLRNSLGRVCRGLKLTSGKTKLSLNDRRVWTNWSGLWFNSVSALIVRARVFDVGLLSSSRNCSMSRISKFDLRTLGQLSAELIWGKCRLMLGCSKFFSCVMGKPDFRKLNLRFKGESRIPPLRLLMFGVRHFNCSSTVIDCKGSDLLRTSMNLLFSVSKWLICCNFLCNFVTIVLCSPEILRSQFFFCISKMDFFWVSFSCSIWLDFSAQVSIVEPKLNI